jgi:hypothetical protein
MRKFCLLLLLLGCSQKKIEAPLQLDEFHQLKHKAGYLTWEIGRVERTIKWRGKLHSESQSATALVDSYCIDGDPTFTLNWKKAQLAEMLDRLDQLKRERR